MALLDSPRSISSSSSSSSSQVDLPLLPTSSPRLAQPLFPSATSANSAQSPPRATRRTLTLLGAGAVVCILLLAWHLPPIPDVVSSVAKSEKELFVSPARRLSSANGERGERRKTAGVKELLLPTAPALSIYDSLDPQLRYLIADSWSGLSGQITSAFALLYLAQQTQRIAILPSWHDEGHYGESIIPMSLLFDLEGLREATGLLFVELDDVKPQDPHHVNTTMDEIGCYRASPWFDIPLSLPDHNIHQTILTIPLPSETPWSYESFTLFDFSPSRLSLAATQASSNGWSLPRNMVEEDPSPQGGGLLCYTNLWDLGHVAGGVRRVEENGHFGNGGFESAKESRMVGLLKADLKGVHPEWWHVGRFVDFTPEIWDIALSSVYETLEVDVLPPLVTVHLRRGDFLSWCPQQQNCTPPASDYAAAVKPLLSLFNSSIIPFSSSPRPRVLVTTDETTDMDFLASIDQLGWDRINHTRLGTERKLREAYGEAWRWADSAVDQAILSLGQHFVGTRGSQVTQLSQLRVESWNGGQTAVVDRPAN